MRIRAFKLTMVLVGLLLLGLTVGFSATHPATEEAVQNVHTVTAVCTPDDIIVSPDQLNVGPEDVVQFVGNAQAVIINHPELTSTKGLRVPGRIGILPDAEPGTYYYEVTCRDGRSTHDPEAPQRPDSDAADVEDEEPGFPCIVFD